MPRGKAESKAVSRSSEVRSRSEATLARYRQTMRERGTSASYEQQALPLDELRGRWRLVASPDGADGSTTIGQDARLWASLLAPGESIDYRLQAGRLGYVQLIYGQLEINGNTLVAGDGAKIADETDLKFLASQETEFLLFDLPPVA